ncbi:MAG: exonuclease domain-containing protein [Halothiobacillaceae bacterium]
MGRLQLSDLLPLVSVLELRRRHLARHARPSPLRTFLESPLPTLSADWRSGHYLVVDFETTGLDSRRDGLLSIGWVGMEGMEVDLGSARHILVRPEQAIPEASAVIHCITDDLAADGSALEPALTALLEALTGRILVAHNARFEMAFLQRACRQLWGAGLALPVIDTMALARRHFEHRHVSWRQDALRLDSLRQQYHLPRYDAHHALSDALATAELFSALVQERLSGPRPLPIRRLISGLW